MTQDQIYPYSYLDDYFSGNYSAKDVIILKLIKTSPNFLCFFYHPAAIIESNDPKNKESPKVDPGKGANLYIHFLAVIIQNM